jgi:superfamily II DNA/RNA helicase
LDGRDIIGLANTGTGKTAAFLIPTINKILNDKKHKAIIITPTRELAIQIQRECIELTKGLAMFNVTCVGGAPIRPQIMALAQKHNIISYLSPLGRALIGKKVGESATLEGGSAFKVQKIEKVSI